MKFTQMITVCAAALPLTVHAVKFVPASVEQLSARAQVVIHGTVREKIVERDDAGRIYTKVHLTVTENWKGSIGSGFTVVQAGGTLGDRTHQVDGQEPLAIGEEVVLFLVFNQRKEGLIIGLSQGKFKVHNRNGERTVQNMFHGKDPRTPLTLQALKNQVKGGRL